MKVGAHNPPGFGSRYGNAGMPLPGHPGKDHEWIDSPRDGWERCADAFCEANRQKQTDAGRESAKERLTEAYLRGEISEPRFRARLRAIDEGSVR